MFTVCHILTSVDGKISGDFFNSQASVPAFVKYGELRDFYGCTATLYGTTTMKEFIGERGSWHTGKPAKRNDNVIIDSSYVVAIDTKGKLNYRSGLFERHGNKSRIIAVLTEQVSDETLDYLREREVAYIFAGENELDPAVVIEKLESEFGINRLMIAGGGYIDWVFLSNDLIDELSIVIAPSADGRSDTPSLFEKNSNADGVYREFRLISAETNDDTVWLRYGRR